MRCQCRLYLRSVLSSIRGTPRRRSVQCQQQRHPHHLSHQRRPHTLAQGPLREFGCIRPFKYRKAFSRMLVVMVAHQISTVEYSGWPCACAGCLSNGHTYTRYIEYHMHCNAVTVLYRSYSVLVLESDEEACRSVHTTGWGMKPKGIVDGISCTSIPLITLHARRNHLARHNSSTTHNSKAYL